MGEEIGEERVEELALREGVRKLRASYEYGVGASIMPVGEGWKVAYFSSPNFESQTGTVFGTFEEALMAIEELLPLVNSAEEKVKARELEEIVWLRLRQRLGDREE